MSIAKTLNAKFGLKSKRVNLAVLAGQIKLGLMRFLIIAGGLVITLNEGWHLEYSLSGE